MKSFIVEKKYILFPISMDAPCKTTAIWSKGEKIFEFDIPVERIKGYEKIKDRRADQQCVVGRLLFYS